jgi:hypothetical protein
MQKIFVIAAHTFQVNKHPFFLYLYLHSAGKQSQQMSVLAFQMLVKRQRD